MGQKIIPISLRLNKKENWHSSWIVEKSEYSFLLTIHFEFQFSFLFNRKLIGIIF